GVDKALHDAREILGRGGFRILAERLGAVDSQALGATAREDEPHFWQIAGLLPDAKRRDRITFDLMFALEAELGLHLASFSATTCVYKVMGAPSVLGAYYPDLRDDRFETIGCFGHNRYSTNTWPSFKRVQPFTVLGHNGEINTIAREKRSSRLHEHWQLQRTVAERWLKRTGAAATAPYDRALETGGPLEGTEIPGYTSAGPSEPVKVEDRVLAGFGWQRDDVKL